MAKKVIATLKTSGGKDFSKVIRMVKRPKTDAYTFKEEIVANEQLQKYLSDNK
jgi:hypothetical protein